MTGRRSGYRTRAHANPLAPGHFAVPLSPDSIDRAAWYAGNADVRIRLADIGCGYGGLLFYLSSYRDRAYGMLGVEIRAAVARHCQLTLQRQRAADATAYPNIAFVYANAQRHLPNLLRGRSLDAMLFAYPDPHFKARTHRRRILSRALLQQYVYFLRPGGRLYASTDVEELFRWMLERLDDCPLLRCVHMSAVRTGQSRFNLAEAGELPAVPSQPVDVEAFLQSDVLARAVRDYSDEGQRVARQHGDKFLLVYEKRGVEEERAAGEGDGASGA